MSSSLICVGHAGARVAVSLLWAAMAGVTAEEDIRLYGLCLPEADRRALEDHIRRYSAVRALYGDAPHAGFRPVLSLVCRPDGEAGRTPASLADGKTDRLLLGALMDPADAARPCFDSPVGSAVEWSVLMRGGLSGTLEELAGALAAGGRAIVCGSLAEPSGSAGIPALLERLRADVPDGDLSAVLLLPLVRGEDTPSAARALGRLPQPLRCLSLIGLPEDCRGAEDVPSMAHWMASHAVDLCMRGAAGSVVYRMPADGISWDGFGEDAWRYDAAYDALTRAAVLWLSQYGPAADRHLAAPSLLRDRTTGWYNAWFGAARRLTAAQRGEQREIIAGLCELFRAYLGWVITVQDSLPLFVRCTQSLKDARGVAAAHYQAVLDRAAQLALIQYDIEQGGMDAERVVHRADMSDTEAEAALRQREELRDALLADLAQQEDLDRVIGGRAVCSRLDAAVRQTKAAADDIRAQADEAQRRIDRAAEIATVEEMAKVDRARSRLARMRRHLAALDGRAARAAEDLRSARHPANRLRAPMLGTDPEERTGFWDPNFLAAVLRLDGTDTRAQKRAQQAVENGWLWTGAPLRQLTDLIARDDGRLAGYPSVARLNDRILTSAGTTWAGGENDG